MTNDELESLINGYFCNHLTLVFKKNGSFTKNGETAYNHLKDALLNLDRSFRTIGELKSFLYELNDLGFSDSDEFLDIILKSINKMIK